MIVDVTDRRLAEDVLRRSSEALCRSNEELAQFAYVASHDLQEPLRKIASFCKLLGEHCRGRLDADADRYIDFAIDGSRRMQTLITDLLALSQVDSRARPSVVCDTCVACDAAIERLEVAIEESGATVTRGVLPSLEADVNQVTQLFQNLIGNAIKFCGDRHPEVRITATRRGGDWEFVVRDDGIGIAPEFHEQIFGVFRRLHGREEFPGNGIGLAICKKIVERSGGRIWVDSVPGRGSKFRFTLPAGSTNMVGPKVGESTRDYALAN
jgi:light-regulated signal transduction histidine kinase (bacteriophytochrome)